MVDVKLVFLFLSGFVLYVESREKFGCVLPEEPFFGRFVFNERKKSYEIECDDDFHLTGSMRGRERKCRSGQWTGTGDGRDCVLNYGVRRQCPKLHDPRNGKVIISGLREGNQATFVCDEDHVLEGTMTVTCLQNQMWSGDLPVCSSRKTAADLAASMKEKFVDRFAGSTVTSEEGAEQSRLSVGKSGLDIVMAVDVSSSISPKSLNIAKNFMKLLVDIFGVSEHTSGGGNGTRFAVMTFTATADLLFNLDDANVRSVQASKDLIDTIVNSGGGTDFREVLDAIIVQIYLDKLMGQARGGSDTNRAVFLITDAEQTVGNNLNEAKQLRLDIKNKAKTLKDNGFEIFTLGVGKHIDTFALADIASTPFIEHVFMINKFSDLSKIGDVISEQNIDYSICGISGNIELSQDADKAKPGAWPWLGWFNVAEKTCGGTLLSDRWFMTSATCVSEVNDTGHVIPYPGNTITLYLGDNKLYIRDNDEIQALVSGVHIHEHYTGEVLDSGIREYDVALLDLGEDSTTRPVLNKFVKPICFPEGEFKSYASSMLQSMKTTPQEARGFTAGWGHAPDNAQQQFEPKSSAEMASAQFLWGVQKQNNRAVQSNKVCSRSFDIDPNKYFCVGNLISESDSCRGDIGGPYMAELAPVRKFVALGLALKTDNCKNPNPHQFSIFLDLNHESITKWINQTIELVENPPPVIEEEEENQEENNEEKGAEGAEGDGKQAEGAVEGDGNKEDNADGAEGNDGNEQDQPKDVPADGDEKAKDKQGARRRRRHGRHMRKRNSQIWRK